MSRAPHWSQFAYLEAMDFGSLASQRIALKIAADGIKEQIDGLNLEIGAYLDTVGAKTVRAELGDACFTITRTAAGASGQKLDPELLVAHGVPEAILKRCTIPTKPRSPGVTVAKEKEGAE